VGGPPPPPPGRHGREKIHAKLQNVLIYFILDIMKGSLASALPWFMHACSAALETVDPQQGCED
jgi:hypothetical protein